MHELLLRTLREVGRHVRQDDRRAFDKNHASLRGIDVIEVAFEDEARQFRAGARQFDAGRAAANDDDGHQRVARFRVRFVFRALEREQ